MKKFFLSLAVLALCFSFVVFGGTGSATAAPSKAPVFNYNITMPTGSMGGSYYTIGAAMSELFTSKLEGVTISASAANTSDNIASLTNKEAILAMAGGPDYVFVMQELPEKSKEISSIGVFNQLVSVIVVREDSPFKSIKDLIGKKINMGSAGSGQYLFNQALLKAAGYSEKDFKCEYMSQGKASEAFAEGKLDGVFVFASLPANAVTQMATAKPCRIIQLSDAFLSKFANSYPYYKVSTVTPDMVPSMGITKPYKSLSQYGELLVRTDVDENFVYWLTKTLHDNHKALLAAAPGAKACTPENAVKASVFNLHPGAKRYYKELNLIN